VQKKNADSYFLLALNFPTPSLISNVLTPGFSLLKPAFEICIYRASTVHVHLRNK